MNFNKHLRSERGYNSIAVSSLKYEQKHKSQFQTHISYSFTCPLNKLNLADYKTLCQSILTTLTVNMKLLSCFS